MKKVGDIIYHKLEELDITQVEFAKQLNISRSSLNGYLHNERQIPFDLLVKMSKVLHISLDHIYHIHPSIDDCKMSEMEFEIIHEYRQLNEVKQAQVHDAFIKILKICSQE